MGTIPYYLGCLTDAYNLTISLDPYESRYMLGNLSYNDIFRLDKACEDVKDNNKYSGPMVWIGIYIAIASLFCTLAMAADLRYGFRKRKLWFPCKYFSLNAASITVIAVAMKLPVDLSSPMPGLLDQVTKLGSMTFMCIMMANIMHSLASMDNKTLLANIIGFAILIITIIVNICIELTTNVINAWFLMPSVIQYDFIHLRIWACICTVLMFLLLLILIASAIAIPTSKQILELKYQAVRKTTSNDQHVSMSEIEKLRRYVRRYWVMAESGSPQFVMTSNPLSNACGIICVITLVIYTLMLIVIFYILGTNYLQLIDFLTSSTRICKSEYKWSMLAIFITQSIGVVVGSIAPIFRCFTVLRFKLFTTNHLAVFKVEKYWTQMLCGWKESRLPFLSSARRSRALFHNLKNLVLSVCIGFQNIVVVSCKMIGLIRIILIIFVLCCSYCWKSLKALFIAPISSSSDDIKDLCNYVLQIQDEMEFAETTVKDISNSMNRLIQKVKKEQHKDLLELLGKSTDFKGVEMFDIDDQVQHLVTKEPINSWSLPVVSLTCIAVALPNIRKEKVEGLLKGVGDGLSYIHLVEESLISANEYINVQRATMNLWHEVEDNFKWLGNVLEGNAYKGKTSQEILQWFADKAKDIVLDIQKSTNGEQMENFPHKLIVANSMYRIAGTLMHNYNSNNERPMSKKQLFVSLSCMISSILSACLTNIPRAIETKCHESVIEKREASVKVAAKLLGRSTEIITKLEARERPPSMDQDKMAFIDEWRLHMKQSIP